jgi:malonyl-CoA reductase/3-hydroxypropionate dehydrogenase (NADP+)
MGASMQVGMGRLNGKNALITGGAGEIGSAITRAYLAEGAKVIIVGRTGVKLEATVRSILAETPEYEGLLFFSVMDNSKADSVARSFQEISFRFGQIDILINNSGTAGPQEELANIPLTCGGAVTETMSDAMGSLLLGPWLTTTVFLPILASGASVINVSTIFSRTPYYGRAAYVVPKATLNALTKVMAQELGRDSRKIRVNTVFPGPVETNRIQRVFGAMDNLRQAAPNTTKSEVLKRMVMPESVNGLQFIPREDVASTIVFLGSDESQSYTAHDFEVTRGFNTNYDSISTLASTPKVSTVGLAGRFTWVIGSNEIDDACEMAERLRKVGSEVFLTFESATAVEAAASRVAEIGGVKVSKWSPRDLPEWEEIESYLQSLNPSGWSVVVLPRNESFRGRNVFKVNPSEVKDFVESEVEAAIIVAKRLEQLFKFHDRKLLGEPTVVFLTDKSDGKGNVFARLARVATRQLLRTWRHENEVAIKAGFRTRRVRVNQLVRYKNERPGNRDICIDWIISLSDGMHLMGAIDLVIDPDLESSKFPLCTLHDSTLKNVVYNLHLDRVALITGGSEGIGGAIARVLALSGSRVVIAERSEEKLAATRQRLITELKEWKYPDPEGRVLTMANCDVSKEETLKDVVETVIGKFGRIDFLINNAGLVGGEEMAVDLLPQVWQQTLAGNLLSNYKLMLEALPHMKGHKSGHIINMSSYFGSGRHGTVAYTNRSDYAVSKAGQISLVEALADSLGPDIQINALAPGPIDGARLNGTKGRPGLYQRRAQLLLENKRLNAVYSAACEAVRAGFEVNDIITLLCEKKTQALVNSQSAPPSLTFLAQAIRSDAKIDEVASRDWFLPLRQFEKILRRFERKGYLSAAASAAARQSFISPPEPFFPTARIEEDASTIRNRMISMIASRRMPSDLQLACELVSALAHRTVTGEVFFPTGGFRYEGAHVADCFGGNPVRNLGSTGIASEAELQTRLQGKLVLICGDAMYGEMANLACRYAAFCQTVVVTYSQHGCQELKHKISACKYPIQIVLEKSGAGDNIFDAVIQEFGEPNIVVSFPTGRLPVAEVEIPNTGRLPSYDGFKSFVATNLTNHFHVSRRAGLIDDCRIILVTHPVDTHQMREHRIWAKFARDTLQPFTMAVAKEATCLHHRVVYFQVSCGEPDAGFYDQILMASQSITQTKQPGFRSAA